MSDKNQNKSLMDFENIIKWESEFKNEGTSASQEIEELFVDSALKYKEERMKLEKTEGNEKQIEKLDQIYLNNVLSTINKIADSLDRHFDKGRIRGDEYSKESLKDLFNKEKFIVQMTENVIQTRDAIMAMDKADKESIHKELLNKQQTSSLEKIGFNDLKELYKFVTKAPELIKPIPREERDVVETIASNEKRLNHEISTLDLPDFIKNRLKEVNQRVSEGNLRHLAYQKEEKRHLADMEGYDAMIQSLLKRLSSLEVRIGELKKKEGVSPENKRLLRYLGEQEKIKEEYDEIRKKREEERQDFRNLEKNKYQIVERDSYKKMKASYDEEMKKESIEEYN